MSSEKQTLLDRIRAIVAEHLGLSVDEVLPDSRILNDLGADSLECIELIMAVEDEFGIEISDEAAQALKTVRDVVSLVEFECPQGVRGVRGVQGFRPPAVVEREVQALTSLQLNWAVTQVLSGSAQPVSTSYVPDYSGNWAVGGPLLKRFEISLEPQFALGKISTWIAAVHGEAPARHLRDGRGEDADQLHAAMRALVHQHCGAVVAVPVCLANA